MANDETLTAIKTPVRFDVENSDCILDRDGHVVADVGGASMTNYTDDLGEYIAKCINEHESLANELRETKAKLADREIVNCAICTTPLPFPETIPGCCFKCALNETEELWGNAIRLRDCVECGQQGFAISPINPSEGFCWKCHKLLTIEKQ